MLTKHGPRMNFFDHIMTRCVLACVYAVAALLTINGQDLNALKKIGMASVTVHDGMRGPPHILRGKNLSLLPYYASGRESVSMCIKGDYSYYWKILEPLGFNEYDHELLRPYKYGNSSESAQWDCTTEKNAEEFKVEAADLLKNFQVILILSDPKEGRKVHYFTSREKEANACGRYSKGTLLTLRPEKPTSAEGVEVQLMWTLYFTNVQLIGDRLNYYSLIWTANYQSLTPALTIEFKSGITINNNLRVKLEPRTPTWQFPLKGVKINLENGSTIDVKEEDILIKLHKNGPRYDFDPVKDFILAGRCVSSAHSIFDIKLNVTISSGVTSIKITFNDTLEMKLGDRKLSMHKALEPKEGEELRVIYTLPSPLTERSEINMSISPSHWYIEKISVIPASGAHAIPCSPDDGCNTANAMCTNRTESDGITRWRCQCTQGNDYIEADDKCSDTAYGTLTRIELVPVKEDTGAMLNYYIQPNGEYCLKEERCLLDLNAYWPIQCKVTSRLHKDFSMNYRHSYFPHWRDCTVLLHKWEGQPTNLTGEAKIECPIEIDDIEGLLSCRHELIELHATMLFRFTDAVSVLFTFSSSQYHEVTELLDTYTTQNQQENTTYYILESLEENTIRARVSFRGLKDEFQGEDLHWNERIRNMREYLEKRKPGAVNLRSTRYCHPERGHGLTRPKTRKGGRTLPAESCPNSDDTIGPLRSCKGDFFEGVYWEPLPSPNDSRVLCHSQRLERLSNLSLHVEKGDSFENFTKEVEKYSKISANEISIITDAIKRVAENISDTSKLSRQDIISALTLNNIVLDKYPVASDNASRTSNELRLATEKLITAAATKDVEPVSLEHVSGFSALPEAGVRGFKGYQEMNGNGTRTVNMTPIFWNKDNENDNASMVVMLLENPDSNTGITAILYNKNSLYPVKPFESYENVAQVGSTVVFSAHENGTSTKLLLLFSKGQFEGAENSKCVFWKENASHWADEGCRPVCNTHLVPPDMFGCICDHLTDFALLVSLPPKNGEWEIDDAQISTVHIVCSSISLLCLVAMFLYAALCPHWCESLYVKINLNLSASVALSLIICVVEEIRRKAIHQYGQSISCIVLGGFQHYFMVASFCWVAVVSVFLASQVHPNNVLRTRMTHLLLRSSVIGWGLPVIPVAVSMGIDTRLYIHRPGTAFCFPDGNAFYFGVLTPTAAAMLTTIVAFAFILWTIFCYKSPIPVISTKPKLLRRFCSAFILLFSLGFYWVIALPLQLLTCKPTAYRYFRLFVASTVVLQGTSQFLLLIALNKSARTMLSQRLSTIFSNLKSSLSSSKKYTLIKDNSDKIISYLSSGKFTVKMDSSQELQDFKQC